MDGEVLGFLPALDPGRRCRRYYSVRMLERSAHRTMLASFIPIDRRQPGAALPHRMRGAVLFADISGFTPMTQFLVEKFGPRRGPELLADELDRV